MDQNLHSSNLPAYTGDLSKAVSSSIEELTEYLNVGRLNVLEWDEHRVAVPITFEVELPPFGNSEGIDIRATENIILVFSKNHYPATAPRVYSDRLDFPKDRLPHLYVSQKDKATPLCLVRGDVNEWFANKQIVDVIKRTHNWMAEAAAGVLAEQGDQFDPIRLEGYKGLMVYSYDTIATLINSYQGKEGDTGYHILFFSLPEKDIINPSGSSAYELITPVKESGIPSIKNLMPSFNKMEEKFGAKLCLGLLVWSQHNTPHDLYQVKLPSTYQELVDFCKSIGINLEAAIQYYISNELQHLVGIPVSIAINRPKNLIGYSDRYEILNFVVLAGNEVIDGNSISPEAKVLLHSHREPLRLAKAKAISGEENLELGKIIAIGAGALGSKVLAHLARSGHGEIKIVDNDQLSPHNLVRHALDSYQVGQNKAKALAIEFNKIYGGSSFTGKDASAYTELTGDAASEINGNNWIFDFTASKSVLHFLAQADYISVRIIKAELAGLGRYGLLYKEGNDRNPRIDDLEVLLYDLYKQVPHISDWLKQEALNSGPELVNVGIGCNSETTIMADDVISLHAATFSRLIKKQCSINQEAEEGLICMHQLDEELIGSTGCNTVNIAPLTVYESKGWQIRMKAGITEEMQQQMDAANPLETGGVLIGQVNHKTKCIHITDLVSAPPDSSSSRTSFVRGIHELPEKIDYIRKESGGMFGYVGEWHSHPMGLESLSSTDMAAVAKLKSELDQLPTPMPVLIMIATPAKILPFVF